VRDIVLADKKSMVPLTIDRAHGVTRRSMSGFNLVLRMSTGSLPDLCPSAALL
jgi:hypothetical protein